jgi:3-methylcrotonyl-CoA carboxylase alpha subunit
MGMRTVAVYSDADAKALHVRDGRRGRAYRPAAGARELSARRPHHRGGAATGAEAIHPGYGFLSENPDFVEAVEGGGLVFIGPSAAAIRAMGLKDAAKR